MGSTTTIVAQHLKAQGVSTCDVADFLDISTTEAADYITGRIPWPMGLLHHLVNHIGLSPEELFS